MLKSRLRLPSPALVISLIALSLVLGGTAVAASTVAYLTKTSGTKLVEKLAPTLSVKHAKTAGRATLLGGKNATSLQTTAYTYALPVLEGVGSFSELLPGLPPGVYYASYDIVSIVGTSGQEVGCSFGIPGTGAYGRSYGAPHVGTSYVSTSGAAVVDTREHFATFDCYASAGTFSVVTDPFPPDVTFLRIDNVHGGTATPNPD